MRLRPRPARIRAQLHSQPSLAAPVSIDEEQTAVCQFQKIRWNLRDLGQVTFVSPCFSVIHRTILPQSNFRGGAHGEDPFTRSHFAGGDFRAGADFGDIREGAAIVVTGEHGHSAVGGIIVSARIGESPQATVPGTEHAAKGKMGKGLLGSSSQRGGLCPGHAAVGGAHHPRGDDRRLIRRISLAIHERHQITIARHAERRTPGSSFRCRTGSCDSELPPGRAAIIGAVAGDVARQRRVCGLVEDDGPEFSRGGFHEHRPEAAVFDDHLRRFDKFHGGWFLRPERAGGQQDARGDEGYMPMVWEGGIHASLRLSRTTVFPFARFTMVKAEREVLSLMLA